MAKYGIALGIFLVAYGLLYRIAQLDAVPGAGWVFYAAGPVAMWMLLTMKRAAGPLGSAPAFGAALGAAFIGASIYCVYVYGYNAFVDDGLIDKVRADATARNLASGKSAEAIAARARLIESLTTPPTFALTIFFQLMIAYGLAAVPIAALRRRKAGR